MRDSHPLFDSPAPRSLTRRRGSLTGVCGGLADYLGVPARWIRLGMMVLTPITSGLNILVYAGLAATLPKEDREDSAQIEVRTQTLPAVSMGWTQAGQFQPASEAQVLCEQCNTVAKPFARYCHRCGASLPL